jgi:hypothetical protein
MLIASLVLPAGGAVAAPPRDPGGRPATEASTPAGRSAVPEAERDGLLGTGWRSTDDLAWTSSGDSSGFHLLVAEARRGYAWRTAATLVEPGFETDRWIGNVCLTGSGARAVVVYAPRQFTNRDQLFERGGFAAVVDLGTGRVTKLGVQTTLAYHNPGCGARETAVLNQAGGQRLGATRLHLVDAAKARVVRVVELPGQATSAVPIGTKIVAAYRDGLTEISASGTTRLLTATHGPASYVRADADGGVAFLETHGTQSVAKHHLAGKTREIARGSLAELGLSAGAAGRVFLTGTPTSLATLPRQVARVKVGANAEVSTRGQLSLRHVTSAAQTVGLSARVSKTGKTVDFQVRPGAAIVAPPAPIVAGARATSLGAQTAGSPTDPVEAERTCAVARNDVHLQVVQPHWKQVEWAANLAVKGALTTARPANWNQSGLPSWTPQYIVPPLQLRGGGRVPAQILLGILAQESNLWQASPHALEGVTGNPLVGDYYGRRSSADGWSIRWSEADCGYGVAQVTDKMRVGQMADLTQKAIAADYATNIAAGLRILQEKWNAVYDYMKINNADPAKIENWFAALWAYNTGIQPRDASFGNPGCVPGGPDCHDGAHHWGLGWLNNPINPAYPANRRPFLEASQDDARTPQKWPYPEKVIGWAAYPITKNDFRTNKFYAGYNQAWWNTVEARTQAKPPIALFCDSSNNCNPAAASPCQLQTSPYEDHCWWHQPATWRANCATDCGNENMRFPNDYPEPRFATSAADEPVAKMPQEHYRPNCDPFSTSQRGTNAVPSNSLIIDDVANSVNSVRPNCDRNWVNAGNFTLDFAADQEGNHRSKIDFHQIGGGMGGHFWFAHAHRPGSNMRVTGTWTLNQPMHGWARVIVHMPDHGAHTQQAKYTVRLGNGGVEERHLQQRTDEHRWVSLGVFPFNGTPSVALSNITLDGDGNEDVAWDAIAFQPLPHKPANIVVALGDSYAAGEGASTNAGQDYYKETDSRGGGIVGPSPNDPGYTWQYGNACHRSKHSWTRMATLGDRPGPSYGDGVDPSKLIGNRADAWDPDVDLQAHACSGARTHNMLPTSPLPGEDITNAFDEVNKGQYHELTQLDQGFLDVNTTMVTLSIGGNDAGFGAVLKECLVFAGPLPCPDTKLAGDTEPMRTALPKRLNEKVLPSIRTTLRSIHRRAPNARIALMGYPVLIHPNGQDINDGTCVPFVSMEEAIWLSDMANDLTDGMRIAAGQVAAATGAQITFVDPRPEMAAKGACGDPELIHAIIPTHTNGEVEGGLAVSQQSFHPKKAGTPLFAGALNKALGHSPR